MNKVFEAFRLFYYGLASMASFIRGLYWLSFLEKPTVTIFGGRGWGAREEHFRSAHDISYHCVERGFSVLTGGGPGTMQAANCGAHEACKKLCKKPTSVTFGIGVQGVDTGFINKCAPVLYVNSFHTRKWLLMHYSVAFIIFPGGVGTMDELYELLNLMKHGIVKRCPVVLFDRQYWSQMVGWFDFAIEQGFIDPKYTDLLHISDDPHEAMDFIEATLKKTKDMSLNKPGRTD